VVVNHSDAAGSEDAKAINGNSLTAEEWAATRKDLFFQSLDLP
jgi:hypothetical protein